MDPIFQFRIQFFRRPQDPIVSGSNSQLVRYLGRIQFLRCIRFPQHCTKVDDLLSPGKIGSAAQKLDPPRKSDQLQIGSTKKKLDPLKTWINKLDPLNCIRLLGQTASAHCWIQFPGNWIPPRWPGWLACLAGPPCGSRGGRPGWLTLAPQARWARLAGCPGGSLAGAAVGRALLDGSP